MLVYLCYARLNAVWFCGFKATFEFRCHVYVFSWIEWVCCVESIDFWNKFSCKAIINVFISRVISHGNVRVYSKSLVSLLFKSLIPFAWHRHNGNPIELMWRHFIQFHVSYTRTHTHNITQTKCIHWMIFIPNSFIECSAQLHHIVSMLVLQLPSLLGIQLTFKPQIIYIFICHDIRREKEMGMSTFRLDLPFRTHRWNCL